MTKLMINTSGANIHYNRLKYSYDALTGYRSTKLTVVPNEYMAGKKYGIIGKKFNEKTQQNENEYGYYTDSDKYTSSVNAYNSAVADYNNVITELTTYHVELLKYYCAIKRIITCCDSFKDTVSGAFQPEFIAEVLNTVNSAYGLSGEFYVEREGEHDFGTITYKFIDEDGQVKFLTLGELTNSFVTMSCEVVYTEATQGTEETQGDIYAAVEQANDLRELTGVYKTSTKPQAVAYVKAVASDQYPELNDVDPKDEKAAERVKEILDIPDLGAVAGEGVEDLGGVMATLAVVDAGVAGVAYTMTDDGVLHINYEDGLKNVLDLDDIEYDESKYTKADTDYDAAVDFVRDRDLDMPEDLQKWVDENEPRPDEVVDADGEEGYYREDTRPVDDGERRPDYTPKEDYENDIDEFEPDDKDNNPPEDDTPQETPSDNQPKEDTPKEEDIGSTNPESDPVNKSEQNPNGNEPKTGPNENGSDPNPQDSNPDGGHDEERFVLGADDRKAPADLITYDDVVDEYLGTEGGADGKPIELQVEKDYDAMALEDYNNSSAEIKAAGVLAAVAEANNLFDTNQALLSSRLIEMGYSDSEIAEIMSDRDLTIQAFTQDARDKEIAKIAEEKAAEDGDTEYTSKYGKIKNVDKLRNGGEEDEETISARKELDDSASAYKEAVDSANGALEKVKEYKSELDSFTEKYGEDYTKWTDEQYKEYSSIANNYNNAVADAKVKVEVAESAKNAYQASKNNYDNLFNNSESEPVTQPNPAEVAGNSAPSGDNPLADVVNSDNPEPVSMGMDNPESILGDAVKPIEQQVEIVNNVQESVPSDNVASIENAPVVEEDSVVNALNASMKTGSEALKNLGQEEPVVESVGMNDLPPIANAIEDNTVNVDTSYKLDLNTPLEGNNAKVPSVGIFNNIGENIVSGMKGNIPVEAISIGTALAIKGLSKLISGDTSKKFVINYDALARYKYEKLDKAERDSYDENIIEETKQLYVGNKTVLEDRLRGYGYNELDISKILASENLTVKAMLDGGRRFKLSEIAKELAAEDGIKEYKSRYFDNISILDLENGSYEKLFVNLTESDPTFDQLSNDYFSAEREFADFANTANKDLEELNLAKDKFNSFISQHGSDSGKWSTEEYKAYEELNNANVEASRVFNESSKKLNDLENTFGELRNRYEAEKSKKVSVKVDPTNVKQLMEQPANG